MDILSEMSSVYYELIFYNEITAKLLKIRETGRELL